AAALLVKVIARIDPGWALRSEISQAIRRVSTRVFPEPAPATTRSGEPSWTTAARCGSLSPSSSSSAEGPRRVAFSAGAARCSKPGSESVVMSVQPYGPRPPASYVGGSVLGDVVVDAVEARAGTFLALDGALDLVRVLELAAHDDRVGDRDVLR